MSTYSPLLLQTQITLPPGGSMGVADSTKLENPFQSPMWLDEIRIRVPPQSLSDDDGQSWSDLGIKLELNNIPLTNAQVPLSLLGKVLNASVEDSPPATNTRGPRIFTWKLPKPLFIPAREYLRPTLYYAPYTDAPTKVVTIIYVCRPLPKGTPTPATLAIPWVSYFKPAYQSLGVADHIDQSNPSDLFNPWPQDLHVQRFVGRLMGQLQAEENRFMSLASANPELNSGQAGGVGTLISAQDSYNNILVRDRTPFAHVFDFIDRAWTVNCILPPQGFYLFNIERLWANYVTSVTELFTVGITMVGWREVVYASQRGY